MIEIVGEKPQRTCSCGTTFKFDKTDVKTYYTQRWAGFVAGGWETVAIRYVVCPGCGKEIKL